MSRATPSPGDARDSGAPLAPDAADAVPTVRVVAGNPTEEELAAAHAVIMAVLAEQAARGTERVEPVVDRWRRGARGMRGPLAAGPGAWAASNGLRGC